MPLVLVVTWRLPRIVLQVTAKATGAVASPATATVRGLSPSTAQFAATPVSSTAWSPGATLGIVRGAAGAIGWGVPPSTLRA